MSDKIINYKHNYYSLRSSTTRGLTYGIFVTLYSWALSIVAIPSVGSKLTRFQRCRTAVSTSLIAVGIWISLYTKKAYVSTQLCANFCRPFLDAFLLITYFVSDGILVIKKLQMLDLHAWHFRANLWSRSLPMPAQNPSKHMQDYFKCRSHSFHTSMCNFSIVSAFI